MNLTIEETSMLHVYRRWGAGGLAEVAMKSYREEQEGIVYELNRKIRELEDQIREMREPSVDWSDLDRPKIMMKGGQ